MLRSFAAMCVALSHYSSHSRYVGNAIGSVHVDHIYGFYAVQLFFCNFRVCHLFHHSDYAQFSATFSLKLPFEIICFLYLSGRPHFP